MTCKDVLDRLQSYVVGEVTEDERASIENHLTSCEACQKEEKMMRWLVVTLDSDTIAQPSPLFVQSVVERLEKRAILVPARVLPLLLTFVLGGLSAVGFLFREGLFRLVSGLELSLARMASGMSVQALLDEFLLPRMGSIYLISLGFAGLLLTAAIIWFVRYYWEPVECSAGGK